MYLVKDEEEEQIMRDVVLLRPQGDNVLLANLFGEQQTVRGAIQKIDFLRHTVHIASHESDVAGIK